MLPWIMYGTLLKITPRKGVWIEIYLTAVIIRLQNRHSPHGECGLKSPDQTHELLPGVVTPRMGSDRQT